MSKVQRYVSAAIAGLFLGFAGGIIFTVWYWLAFGVVCGG